MDSKIQNTFAEGNLRTNYFHSTCYTSKTDRINCWVTKIKFITNAQQNSEIETPSEVSALSKHFTCERNQRFSHGSDTNCQ